jgi:hypothetical protein
MDSVGLEEGALKDAKLNGGELEVMTGSEKLRAVVML